MKTILSALFAGFLMLATQTFAHPVRTFDLSDSASAVPDRSDSASGILETNITSSAIFATNQDLEQDSTEASSDVMVPFRLELNKAAHRHHVPAALLAAFCQEESGFNPWAERSEPGYMRNAKVKRASQKWSKDHGGIPTTLTEQTDRAKSFGPMQVMGEVAREQGFDKRYLSELFEPFNSIDQGAVRLKTYLTRYGRDTLAAISAYNQGNARKVHGSFENARYVYRVAVAWKHYSTLFKYSHAISITPKGTMAARSVSNGAFSSSPDSLSTSRDTTHESSSKRIRPERQLDDNNSNGNGPQPAGYSLGARHSEIAPVSASQSEYREGRYDNGSLRDRLSSLFLGFCFFGSMLGLGYSVWRYERNWSGHSKRVSRPGERHFLGITRYGRTSSHDRSSFHTS